MAAVDAAARDVERAVDLTRRAREILGGRIRTASAFGATAADIAAITGLSRPRIYQILDGG